MLLSLTRHPDTPCEAVRGIAVEISRAGSLLSLRYVVSGDLGGLVLSEPGAPTRADGLWKHTCFEAFVRPGPVEAYAEFNLAPSRQWAAYRFEGYRQGMSDIEDLATPAISLGTSAEQLILDAVIATGLAAPAVWCVGLAAVIETKDGRVSYWALAHPPGKPDFHHADCFALELPETEAP